MYNNSQATTSLRAQKCKAERHVRLGKRRPHQKKSIQILPQAPLVWLRPLIAVLAVLFFASLFSGEIVNSDFWWHLKTGEFIWQTRSLPSPDPFAYTTAMSKDAYPGEEITRHFNLTHEWLAQVGMYLTWRTGGFGGVVLGRAGILIIFCVFVGLITHSRCGGHYRPLAAASVSAAVVQPLVADRPYILTYAFLGAVILILELRRTALLWILPLLMLIWANCHGGFFLGWIVIGAYLLESVAIRGRKLSSPDRTPLVAGTLAMIVSLINPNGLRVIQVLTNYRSSTLTSSLLEWQPPTLWPPMILTILLVAAGLVLLFSWRRVRPVDWLLFLTFGGASLLAGRNSFLVGLWMPVLIATYLPWKMPVHRFAEMGLAALLLLANGSALASGHSFQLRVADWAFPSGAAQFLLSHHITDRIFNTYEQGGYFIWKLWPQERVFVDGRALSESVFRDYQRILYAAAGPDGDTANHLLDQYGVQAVVMNSFEYSRGVMYQLAPVLADPDTQGWSLVYADAQAMIFLRHPPSGTEILDSSRVLSTIESECEEHLQHEPWFPGCARKLGEMHLRMGDTAGARRWLGLYLQHAPGKDLEAEAELQQAVRSEQ